MHLKYKYGWSFLSNEKDHLYFLIVSLFMCVGEFFDGLLGNVCSYSRGSVMDSVFA